MFTVGACGSGERRVLAAVASGGGSQWWLAAVARSGGSRRWLAVVARGGGSQWWLAEWLYVTLGCGLLQFWHAWPSLFQC